MDVKIRNTQSYFLFEKEFAEVLNRRRLHSLQHPYVGRILGFWFRIGKNREIIVGEKKGKANLTRYKDGKHVTFGYREQLLSRNSLFSSIGYLE